jgi:hypothetical protein
MIPVRIQEQFNLYWIEKHGEATDLQTCDIEMPGSNLTLVIS